MNIKNIVTQSSVKDAAARQAGTTTSENLSDPAHRFSGIFASQMSELTAEKKLLLTQASEALAGLHSKTNHFDNSDQTIEAIDLARTSEVDLRISSKPPFFNGVALDEGSREAAIDTEKDTGDISGDAQQTADVSNLLHLISESIHHSIRSNEIQTSTVDNEANDVSTFATTKAGPISDNTKTEATSESPMDADHANEDPNRLTNQINQILTNEKKHLTENPSLEAPINAEKPLPSRTVTRGEVSSTPLPQSEQTAATASTAKATALESTNLFRPDPQTSVGNTIVTGSTNSVGSTTPTTPPSTHHIPEQVGTSKWETSVGQKIVWMIKSDTTSAVISINPPELGPMTITVKMERGEATASFTSDQMEVRKALEDSIPRLREAMNDAGITLSQTTVSRSGSDSDKGTFGSGFDHREKNKNNRNAPIEDDPLEAPQQIRSVSTGLVDTFA